jgi:hypothetical protein
MPRCSVPPPSRSPAPTRSATTSCYKQSLHRDLRDATIFHGTRGALIALGAIVVLIPGTPLGLITTGVQALAGVLLPSATVFLLLCNDRHVLGPWTNPRWLNALTALVVGVLVALSTALTITTISRADISTVGVILLVGLVLALAAAALAAPIPRNALRTTSQRPPNDTPGRCRHSNPCSRRHPRGSARWHS